MSNQSLCIFCMCIVRYHGNDYATKENQNKTAGLKTTQPETNITYDIM